MNETNNKQNITQGNPINSFKSILIKINRFYNKIGFEQHEYLTLIIIGFFAALAGQYFQLKTEFKEVQQIAQVLAKKTNLKIYSNDELEIRQVEDVYVNIPKEWTNIIPNYMTDDGLNKHYIASFGNNFALPLANEYAFVVGVERRGVKTDLETFLKNVPVSSDPNNDIFRYTKVNNDMFYIPRNEVGREYFKKVGDVVLVIFVYDNGDRDIDDFEQHFIDSVRVVEKNTLFDYK